MQLTGRRKPKLNGGQLRRPGFQPGSRLMIKKFGGLKSAHWNVGHSREIGWQFSIVVTAKGNPTPSQHGGKITVLKQHVRPGDSDSLLTNYRIIIRRRKENRTRNSTGNIFDTQKSNVAEFEAFCPQQGFYIWGFGENGNHLRGLLKGFFAAANKNLFHGESLE